MIRALTYGLLVSTIAACTGPEVHNTSESNHVRKNSSPGKGISVNDADDGSNSEGEDYSRHKYVARKSFHEASGYEVLVDANRLVGERDRPQLRELVQVKWYTPWEEGKPTGSGVIRFSDGPVSSSEWSRSDSDSAYRSSVATAFEKCLEGASWITADESFTPNGWDQYWVVAFSTLHYLTHDPRETPLWHRAKVPLIMYYKEHVSDEGEIIIKQHVGIVSNTNTEWVLVFEDEDTGQLLEAMNEYRNQSQAE